jgi:hypothetical protein
VSDIVTRTQGNPFAITGDGRFCVSGFSRRLKSGDGTITRFPFFHFLLLLPLKRFSLSLQLRRLLLEASDLGPLLL